MLMDGEGARDDLIIKYKPYAERVAVGLIKKMGLPIDLKEEFVSSAYLGLVEAAGRYVPNSSVPFENFAYLRIRGAVIDNIRKNSQLRGKHYYELRSIIGYHETAENYVERKMAKRETLSTAESALDLLSYGVLAMRLSNEIGEKESEDAEHCPPIAEEHYIRREQVRFIFKCINELPAKERLIINSIYRDGKSLTDICDADPTLSKSWVSRLHARGIEMVRQKTIELYEE